MYELDINKVTCSSASWMKQDYSTASIGSIVHEIVSGPFLLQLRREFRFLTYSQSVVKEQHFGAQFTVLFRACFVSRAILGKFVKPFEDKHRAWWRTIKVGLQEKLNWDCSLPGYHWPRIHWSLGDFASAQRIPWSRQILKYWTFGLGSSYRLPSALGKLNHTYITNLFYEKLLEYRVREHYT